MNIHKCARHLLVIGANTSLRPVLEPARGAGSIGAVYFGVRPLIRKTWKVTPLRKVTHLFLLGYLLNFKKYKKTKMNQMLKTIMFCKTSIGTLTEKKYQIID